MNAFIADKILKKLLASYQPDTRDYQVVQEAVRQVTQLQDQLAQAQEAVASARKVIEQDKSAMGRILLITGLENGDRRKQILEAYEHDAAWLSAHTEETK